MENSIRCTIFTSHDLTGKEKIWHIKEITILFAKIYSENC